MNPNVNCRLWVIMTYQCRFPDFNKCATLGRMLIMREGMHVLGQGVHEKFLYLPLNFTVYLNSL